MSTQYLEASTPVHVKGLLGSSQGAPEQRVSSDHGKGPRTSPEQLQCFPPFNTTRTWCDSRWGPRRRVVSFTVRGGAGQATMKTGDSVCCN